MILFLVLHRFDERFSNCIISRFDAEVSLIHGFVEIFSTYDPDMILGMFVFSVFLFTS